MSCSRNERAFAGLAVVEDECGAGRQAREDAAGGGKGLRGEVGNDAEPGGDGGAGEVEAGVDELLTEGLPFEVDRDEGGGGGQGEGGGAEAVALPSLGCGVVDLEDADVGEGVAEGEGVEAGAKDKVLQGDCLAVRGCGVGDCGRQDVFGEAGAGDHPGTEVDGEWFAVGGGGACQLGGGFGAEDGDGKRVRKYEGVVVDELVRGAAQGDTKRGAGGLSFNHGSTVCGLCGCLQLCGDFCRLSRGVSRGSEGRHGVIVWAAGPPGKTLPHT